MSSESPPPSPSPSPSPSPPSSIRDMANLTNAVAHNVDNNINNSNILHQDTEHPANDENHNTEDDDVDDEEEGREDTTDHALLAETLSPPLPPGTTTTSTDAPTLPISRLGDYSVRPGHTAYLAHIHTDDSVGSDFFSLTARTEAEESHNGSSTSRPEHHQPVSSDEPPSSFLSPEDSSSTAVMGTTHTASTPTVLEALDPEVEYQERRRQELREQPLVVAEHLIGTNYDNNICMQRRPLVLVIMSTMALLIAISVVVTVTGLFVGFGGNHNGELTTTTTTTATTFVPTTAPTMSAFVTIQTLLEISIPNISDTIFNLTTSAQYQAIDWLATDDNYNQHLPISLEEQYALAIFYYSGERSPNFDWMTARPICDWYGILCCNITDDDEYDDEDDANDDYYRVELDCTINGTINGLNLDWAYLNGIIPTELGFLTNLQYLNFEHNDFTGTIPSEIGLLRSLTHLDISLSHLTETIPSDIGMITNLEYLLLDGNDLTGTIPTELVFLTNLVYLSLGDNNLTGTIPSEVGLLAYLQTLRALVLGFNTLTGTIPSELGFLMRLEVLSLESNILQGEIPSSLSSMANLQVLDLAYNLLSGTIPPELSYFTNLWEFIICGNDNLRDNVNDLFCNVDNNYKTYNDKKFPYYFDMTIPSGITCDCCNDVCFSF